MTNILVTGGAGFIGSHLVDALIEKGYNVSVIDDLSTGKEENLNPNSHIYRIKVQDGEVEELFKRERFSYLFHLAAQVDVRKSCKDPLQDASSNIMGTLNLLFLAKKYRVKKFIFSSSGGVMYGDVQLPAQEGDPERPLSPYGIAKLTAELYIKLFGGALPYTILRYANVYGERQDPCGEAGVVSIFIQKMLHKEPCVLYGYGKPQRDYLYVKDVVRATILCMDKGKNETINIGTGRTTSVEQLYSLLKKIVGDDTAGVSQPLRAGELNSNCLSIEKAKRELGWKPQTQIKDGLLRVVEWMSLRSIAK